MVVKYFIVDYCIYMYYITLLAFSYYYSIVLLDKKDRKKERKKESMQWPLLINTQWTFTRCTVS